MACRISKKIPKSCSYNVGGVQKAYLANTDQIESFTDTNADDVLDLVTFKETYTISGVSAANPAVVTTSAPHTYNGGDTILIVGTSPMDGLVGSHEIAAVLTSTTFSLLGFDSTALAAFGASSVTVQNGAFYEYEFHDNTSSFSSELQVGDGNKFFNHTVVLKLASTTAETKAQMDQLGLAKITAVILTKSGQYIIAGLTNGMEATVLSFTSGTAAGDFAGYNITLVGVELANPAIWDNTVTGLPLFE